MADTTTPENPFTQEVGSEQENEARLQSLLQRAENIPDARNATPSANTNNIVEWGDTFALEFKGRLLTDPEGEFRPNMSTNVPMMLELNKGENFIEDLEEGLRGKTAGSHIIPVTFPENYQAKELRGAKAEFIVTISDLQKTSQKQSTEQSAEAPATESNQPSSITTTLEQADLDLRIEKLKADRKKVFDTLQPAFQAVEEALGNEELKNTKAIERAKEALNVLFKEMVQGSHTEVDHVTNIIDNYMLKEDYQSPSGILEKFREFFTQSIGEFVSNIFGASDREPQAAVESALISLRDNVSNFRSELARQDKERDTLQQEELSFAEKIKAERAAQNNSAEQTEPSSQTVAQREETAQEQLAKERAEVSIGTSARTT